MKDNMDITNNKPAKFFLVLSLILMSVIVYQHNEYAKARTKLLGYPLVKILSYNYDIIKARDEYQALMKTMTQENIQNLSADELNIKFKKLEELRRISKMERLNPEKFLQLTPESQKKE